MACQWWTTRVGSWPISDGSISAMAWATVKRAALQDRFAQADQPLIGVDLEEEPARFDEKGFEFGDFHEDDLLSD